MGLRDPEVRVISTDPYDAHEIASNWIATHL